MKRIAFALILLAIVATTTRADDRPSLTIDKALSIAQGYLRKNGHDKGTWIESIVLEPETIRRQKFHWFAKWSPSIALDGRKELGLEIQMDGTIARIVDKKATQK